VVENTVEGMVVVAIAEAVKDVMVVIMTAAVKLHTGA
jgi:hypothetical protein